MRVAPFIVITGMHRSGTSYLAKRVHDVGLNMGGICKHKCYDNPTGQYEHIALARLSEDALVVNGGSWHEPPNVLTLDNDHLNRVGALTDGIGGYKNPRAMLTLKLWSSVIKRPVIIAGIFRHPLKVAESLKNRNKFSYEKSIRLWKHYNLALIGVLDTYGGSLINFDNIVNDSEFKRSDKTFDGDYKMSSEVIELHKNLITRAG